MSAMDVNCIADAEDLNRQELGSFVSSSSLWVSKVIDDRSGGTVVLCQKCNQDAANFSVKLHLGEDTFVQGWVGAAGLGVQSSAAAPWGALLCRGASLSVIAGAVKEDKRGDRFVGIIEVVLERIAPEPWAVFRMLTSGWHLCQSDEAVGAALGGCDAARLNALRCLAETLQVSGKDIFSADKSFRGALQVVCDSLRKQLSFRTGPRQRSRKTTKGEWDALRRADARWPPLQDEDADDRGQGASETLQTLPTMLPTPVSTPQPTAQRSEWGALDPNLNLPDRNDPSRKDYIELKKKPQISWLCTKIEALVDQRRAEGLLSSSALAHLVDIGGGRGDLAIVVAASLSSVRVTVVDLNEPSLEAGRERAVALNLTNINFILADIEDILRPSATSSSPGTGLEGPVDLVFGLHCCGGLSEAAVKLAIDNAAAFAICTCCFRSNPHLAKYSRPSSTMTLSHESRPGALLEEGSASLNESGGDCGKVCLPCVPGIAIGDAGEVSINGGNFAAVTSMQGVKDVASCALTPEAKASAAAKIYKGALLAPMVRCGHLPFRSLCLDYGASAVWSEELIDHQLVACTRVENGNLGTVDFVDAGGAVLFQTLPELERGKLVCQLGTADPTLALAAARVVERDVAAVEINMGCPKAFSIQGGMGAALLYDPEKAESIVKALSENISVPVSVKIRLLPEEKDASGPGSERPLVDELHGVDQELTCAFAKRLVAAGAAAVVVHCRLPADRSHDGRGSGSKAKAARWGVLDSLAKAINPVPLVANGDFYNVEESWAIAKTAGCSGIMLARPALQNASIFRAHRACSSSGSTEEGELDPLDEVIKRYVKACIHFEAPLQTVKYTVSEMLSSRRHPPQWVDSKELEGRGLPSLDRVGKSKSLLHLASMCGLVLEKKSRSNNNEQLEHLDQGLVAVSAAEYRDLRAIATLAESEDSELQTRAMTLINRARLAVAASHFASNHNRRTESGSGGLNLSVRQESFSADFSHRNRVLVGSVTKAP